MTSEHPVAEMVTIVVPTIPSRWAMLDQALKSIEAQTVWPARVITEHDPDRTGSAATRNRALAKVKTEFVLWLDDDDVLMPNAVQLLVEAQQANAADVVSGPAWIPQLPWHAEPTAPLEPGWILPADVQARSRLTVTSLMRTALVRSVGGFVRRHDPGTSLDLDDYGLYYALAEAGATFYRIPETVFIWNVHGANTSGRGDRW